MSRWTATRIAGHPTSLLCDARLILVSNRAPYSHRWHGPAPPEPSADNPSATDTTVWDFGWLRRLSSQVSRLLQGDHALRWSQPAGGLTSALDPVMQACHGTWVAWGSGSADRHAVDARDHVHVPPHDPQYTLRRVWLSEAQVEGFYYGFANSALWPLCHLHLQRAVFKPLDWHHYQEVNAHFATAVAEECSGERAIVWLQDYHLALCSALLRQHIPDLAIMHFWHIPWPPWELYRACPWRRELLKGLLGNDLLGFHLAQYCHNFLECAERALGASVDYKAGVVEYEGRETWVRPFPISIDSAWWTRLARGRRVARQIVRLRAQPALAFPILGLGVDRLDYTKGIVHRLEAIERFLEKYPEYQGRFGFVQIAVPGRTQIEDYRRVKAQVESAVERINARFGMETTKLIHYRYAHLEPAELAVYYRMADFAMVTSLQDGMNLVAKEFIASQVEQHGVLICSEFAGAAEALDNALLINPYDIESVADTLKQAIEMSCEEKAHRMARLQTHLAEHNIYKWLADIFTTLERIQGASAVSTLAVVEAPADRAAALVANKARGKFSRAWRRLSVPYAP
jgi:alpha,alpha-trehalose-phosphate synthase [UDP-forming]